MRQTIYTGKLIKRSWNEVKGRVGELNPELSQILDVIPKINDHSFYVAEYSYGSPIVKDGVLNIPDMSGQVLPISHSNIPRDVYEQLSYRSIPITILLKNTCEVFIEDHNAVMPVRLFDEGEGFGLFELFDEQGMTDFFLPTNVSSGARTMFMLPKISNSILFKKLNQSYNSSVPVPSRNISHYQTFSSIAFNECSGNKWVSEVLFFSRDIAHALLRDEVDFLLLKSYFFKKAWKESYYLRSQSYYNELWKLLAEKTNMRKLKPKLESFEVVKHLLGIALGDIPGFRPSGLNEKCGPIKLLHEVFVKKYGLINHFPTIMHPHHFNFLDNMPVYYGLAMSTKLDVSVENKRPRNVISDLLEVKLLFDTLERDSHDYSNPVKNILTDIERSFFHEAVVDGGVLSAGSLPNEDQDFVTCYGEMGGRQFSCKNTFVRGCVRLSRRLVV